eukprot:TRINITY_DN1553_c0_g1_i1.p1 TRINITY_DN1553_c0_g1~~TRINITY_DN1553_c0_g1_i1.p1  ORF type:complete len:270 (+),score=67.55 TRINITY_DN1553_c0_g1_i1:76-885(+)
MKHPLLILLIGLPGCGKSYLASNVYDSLLSSFENENEKYFTSDRIELIEFDKISQNLHESLNESQWSPQIWHQSRKIFIETVKEALINQKKIVIVDDNLQLTSLRKPFWRLAEKYSYSTLSIFIDAPLNHCLYQNSLRSGNNFVSEKIIKKMKIDVPIDDYNNGKHVIIVPTSDLTFDLQINIKEYLTNNNLCKIQVNHTHEREIQNDQHNFDIRLRRISSQLIDCVPLDKKQELAKFLSNQKKKLLKIFVNSPDFFENKNVEELFIKL